MTFHQPGKGNQNKAKLQQLPFDKSEPSRTTIPSLQGKHCPFLFFLLFKYTPTWKSTTSMSASWKNRAILQHYFSKRAAGKILTN